MLNSFLEAVSVTTVINAVSAANTAAATSGWIDVRYNEGILLFVIDTGIVVGSITYTFQDANTSGGGSPAAIVPIGGAIAAITTANDNAVNVAAFPATQPRGWMQVVGTIATGPALISYSVVHLPKY